MKRGQHPNSKANLKPIKKGQVLNPEGRPPGPNFQTQIKHALDIVMAQKDPVTKEIIKAPVSRALVYQLIALGLKGDLSAIKEIIDRVDGKVPQKSEHTSPDGSMSPGFDTSKLSTAAQAEILAAAKSADKKR